MDEPNELDEKSNKTFSDVSDFDVPADDSDNSQLQVYSSNFSHFLFDNYYLNQELNTIRSKNFNSFTL
jgi:hypothetical protein